MLVWRAVKGTVGRVGALLDKGGASSAFAWGTISEWPVCSNPVRRTLEVVVYYVERSHQHLRVDGKRNGIMDLEVKAPELEYAGSYDAMLRPALETSGSFGAHEHRDIRRRVQGVVLTGSSSWLLVRW